MVPESPKGLQKQNYSDQFFKALVFCAFTYLLPCLLTSFQTPKFLSLGLAPTLLTHGTLPVTPTIPANLVRTKSVRPALLTDYFRDCFEYSKCVP